MIKASELMFGSDLRFMILCCGFNLILSRCLSLGTVCCDINLLKSWYVLLQTKAYNFFRCSNILDLAESQFQYYSYSYKNNKSQT